MVPTMTCGVCGGRRITTRFNATRQRCTCNGFIPDVPPAGSETWMDAHEPRLVVMTARRFIFAAIVFFLMGAASAVTAIEGFAP